MTLFKFAGDKEETRNLLVEISKKNPKQDGIRPVLVTEALAMACQTAYECGWSVLARDSLEFMIENVVLETSQPDVPELDVDMLVGEWLKLHACDSDDQRGRSTKIVTIFESVLTRLQASELSRFQDSTLVTIANRLDNIAISLHSVTYPKKEVGEPLTHNAECLEALEAMAKLWHLSAQFLLMIPSASDANEIETDAKQHLFQSAACNIIISRNINSNQLKSPRGKQRLQHALDCLTRLHELRDMEVPNDKSREDEFLMRLEVELLLQKNEAHLDKVFMRSHSDIAFTLMHRYKSTHLEAHLHLMLAVAGGGNVFAASPAQQRLLLPCSPTLHADAELPFCSCQVRK